MGMRCPIENADHAELLLDYCARKLSGRPLEEFERHLVLCLKCKEFCSRQEALWNTLDVWEAEPVGEQFDSKLYARIESFENRSWWQRMAGRGFARRPAVSLAGACAALAVALLVHGPANQPRIAPVNVRETRETTRVDALEPEQIERALEDLEMLKQLSPSNSQNL
jgi:hypothetical protein